MTFEPIAWAPADAYHPLGYETRCADGSTFLNAVQMPVHAVEWRYLSAQVPDVNWLSNVIRQADGNNSLGAGALAEKIVEAMLEIHK